MPFTSRVILTWITWLRCVCQVSPLSGSPFSVCSLSSGTQSWGPVHAPGTPRGGISTCYLDLLCKEFIWQLSYLFTLWVVVQQCYSWYQIVRLWSVVVLPSCLLYPCDMPPFFIFRELPYFVVLQDAAASFHFPALKPAISPGALVPFIGEWC